MFSEIKPQTILKAILSNPYNKDEYRKATLKKVIIKNNEIFQIEILTKTQSFTSNYDENNIIDALESNMKLFSQAEVWTDEYHYSFRITSKGKILSNRKKQANIIKPVLNNKEKNYIIKEGMIVPPLIDLGVMTQDGKICKSHYDKYKQINKYLEILDSTIGYEENLNIVDFGCGKSYLTFIVYYYLKYIKGINCNIIGLDLKKEVIDKCNLIRDKYKYEGINFIYKDISLFNESDKLDMIMTLHACDTATDYSLYHAIRLKAKYILSVPCCQKEINKQLDNKSYGIITKYGLLKERFSAILTDTIRANILEYYGYRVNVGEFVDFDASPKNVLIKGILTTAYNENAKKEVEDIINKYNIKQTLYELCFKK